MSDAKATMAQQSVSLTFTFASAFLPFGHSCLLVVCQIVDASLSIHYVKSKEPP